MSSQDTLRPNAMILMIPVIALPLVVACPRGESTPEPESPSKVARASRSIDYQVFAPLGERLGDERLPFLLAEGRTVDHSSCFLPVEEPTEAGVVTDLDDALDQHRMAISEILVDWARAEVGDDVPRTAAIDTWRARPENLVAREIDDRAVRFVEDPECIDNSTGWMSSGVRPVGGLFGAKTIRFGAKVPLGRKAAEAVREAFEGAGLIFETDDLIDLELVVDDDGQPMKGDRGEKLYRHPTEGVVSELDITPPAKQRMKTWTVDVHQPVFFGYRELSKVGWHREADRERCNVNIVWMDPMFRGADCDEFTAATFKATKVDGQIEIQMRTGEDEAGEGEGEGEKTFSMEFETTRRFQLSDRIILWLNPVEIEEGALIRLNSVVLDPGGS